MWLLVQRDEMCGSLTSLCCFSVRLGVLFGTARNAGVLSKVTHEEQDLAELDPVVRMERYTKDKPTHWPAERR